MMTEPTERDLVYTPQEVATYSLEEIERRRANPHSGITLGIESVDRRLKPLRPGELVTIIARPSHYKSGLAQWWARRLALEVLEQELDEVVVYGSCEMAVEELGIYDLSVAAAMDADQVAAGELDDAQFERLSAAGMTRAARPLWLLGHSLARRRKRIRMTVYRIEQALFWVEDNWKFKARVVFLDYLNLMQSERRMGQRPERRIDVSEIVQCAKDLALSLGCPVVMLAQAGRQVDTRDWKLPTMADCMETAAIEQYSDKILSLWMPKVTEPLGAQIQAPGADVLTVTENLLLLGLIKQKTGPAGGYFTLYVTPERNEIRAMDAHAEDPAPHWGDF